MRATLFSLVVFLLAAIAMPFFFFGPHGGPLLSWRKLLPDVSGLVQSAGEVTSAVKRTVGSAAPASPGQPAPASGPFKWQDDKGSWHLSDQPPADGRPYQAVSGGGVNVVPARPAASPQAEPAADGNDVKVPSMPFLTADPAKVLEEAKKLNKTISQRNAALDQINGQ